MSLRENLSDHGGVVSILSLVAFVAALAAVAWSLGWFTTGPDLGPRNVYYWDLAEGKTFVASNQLEGPVEGPSGQEGVRAYLYSCGQCTPEQWFGYLEKFDEPRYRRSESTSFLPGEAQDAATAETEERFVRLLDDRDWVRAESEEGIALQRELMSRCSGESPKWCAPTSE